MKQKIYRLTRRAFLLLLLVMVFAGSTAQAQTEARLYLQPVASESDQLVFEVMAENVTDLYGAEFRLAYDPASLAVQDLNANQAGVQIVAGNLLPENSGFVVANKVDEQAGTITFAMTLLNPAPAVSGSGPLARLAFNVIQNTPSTIEIAHAKLVAVDLQTIPSQTNGFSVSAQAGGASATGSGPQGGSAAFPATFPWWIVAGAIIILGTLALGALIMWGSPSSKQSSALVEEAKPLKQLYAHESATPVGRPSAFKQQTFPSEQPRRPE
jgi:hypothetical protein